MNHAGDQFDADDIKALAAAERRLKELAFVGTAAVRTSSGETKVMRSFDPTAEETNSGFVGG
jgi:hypothetical protein